jgi:hypothetical protein
VILVVASEQAVGSTANQWFSNLSVLPQIALILKAGDMYVDMGSILAAVVLDHGKER